MVVTCEVVVDGSCERSGGDLEALHERVAVVAQQEAQAKGVEQEQRDALALGHAAADLVGDVGERAVRPHAQNRHAFVCGSSQIRLVSSQGPGLAWFSVRWQTYRGGFKRAETRNWSEHE
jgi:hypothetical protein